MYSYMCICKVLVRVIGNPGDLLPGDHPCGMTHVYDISQHDARLESTICIL